MTRSLCWLVVPICWASHSAAAAAPDSRLRAVATEIRGLIADVREATAEATDHDKNLQEICFRIGNLYQSARHELQEVSADKSKAHPAIKELIADSKSLPSFCGDKEKTKADAGYEQVPKGDLVRLERELGNMDRRAKLLIDKP
jgi:chromosome segregation ATPase